MLNSRRILYKFYIFLRFWINILHKRVFICFLIPHYFARTICTVDTIINIIITPSIIYIGQIGYPSTILILSYLPSSAFQYLHRHVNMLSYFKAYFLKHLNSYKDFITGKWYLSNQEIHAFKIHYLKQRFSDRENFCENHIRRSLR